MVSLAVELPADVFAEGPGLLPQLTNWDGAGFPAGVALAWVESRPFEEWSSVLLSRIDPAELGPEELPRYVAALDRMESAAGARKAAAIARLAGPEPASLNTGEAPAVEVSVALRLPVGAAHNEVFRARRLATHLPGTAALFADGHVTARHVARIAELTHHLDGEQCQAVEALVLADAPGQSVGEFAGAVRRAVARVAPTDFAVRHAEAAAKSDVYLEHDADAMSWLTAWLPTVDAVVVAKAAEHYARSRKRDGDSRPIGVLKAEALRVFAEGYLTGRLTGSVPTHHGRPVELQLCVTPQALAGLIDTPAEIPGVGPVPVETVRELAAHARARWLTISDDDGRLLDFDPATYRIPTRLAAAARATYVTSVAPHSTVPAERCDLDHVIPHPAGPTDVQNLAPIDRHSHRAKTGGQLRVRRAADGSLTWTTPRGQTHTVRPYDYRLGP